MAPLLNNLGWEYYDSGELEPAEDYAAVGRMDDAREQARLAIPLLEPNDPSLAEDPARKARLLLLAGDG
jgi:hypothetical protein